MQRIRFTLFFAAAYLNKFKSLIFSGIVVGIAVFFLFRQFSPFLFVEKERIGITGRYPVNNLPLDILNMLSEGLTSFDDFGNVVPSLAQKWETPDKGKTWIFSLSDGIFWQDGKRLVSQEIIYQFSDVKIETPDEKTIVFKLDEPFSPFPGIVSRPTFRKGFLGTGKWKVKKIIVNGNFVQELIIENKGGEEGMRKQKIFRFYPSIDGTKLAFKLGEIDSIKDLIDPSPLDKWRNTEQSLEINKNQVVTIFFNTQDELLSDKSVRQALTYALDKEKFMTRALGPITPNSWAYNPQIKEYDYNVERAKELIEKIGKERTKKLKLASSPFLLNVAEKVAQDWREIGLDVVIQVSSIIPSEFQTYLTVYEIPRDPDQYAIWHSTQKSINISKYSDPRIDKLLEDGRTLLEIEERRKVYLDFQRFLLEELPAAFLYHPVYYTIRRR